MKITVVNSHDAEKFAKQVNKHLAEGWTLFGEPKIETVVQQHTWEDKPYSVSHTVYNQVLKFE